MLRLCLKTIFYVVQLVVCFIFLIEKRQPIRFPAPQTVGRLPAKHPVLRHPAYRHSPYHANQPPRRRTFFWRIFSWRRLLFLLR